MKGDPNKRPKNKYCRFHLDHGHNTSECYDLKQWIKALIKQGKLQQFVRNGENPLRDPKPNRRAEEKPRALLGEIRVIVDNGSSADILYYTKFQQMRVDRERFLLSDTSLIGFGGTKVFPVGTITFLATIRTYP